jgi:type II secretory pathway component GspD/PulD (secretin)
MRGNVQPEFARITNMRIVNINKSIKTDVIFLVVVVLFSSGICFAQGNSSAHGSSIKVRTAAKPRVAAVLRPLVSDPAAPTPSMVSDGTICEAAPVPKVKLYDVNAYQSDIAVVLNSLAQDADSSIVMAGGATGKVTVNLHQVPMETAIDYITKAAGLSYHQVGNTFVIGETKDIQAAYPAAAGPSAVAVYRCEHIKASDLVTSLESMYDKSTLKVVLGAGSYAPDLDSSIEQAADQIKSSSTTSTTTSANSSNPGLETRMVILSGDPATVDQALTLAKELDIRRKQVKISVEITDISVDAAKDLGADWTFGNVSITENQPTGINFGTFTRSPLSVEATISALETKNLANLLETPTITLLDGGRGYILVGQRLLYPVLIGYTQAQTPIFDKAEENVGIYLQVAAEVGDDGDITMTIYPQVSEVTGYLTVNQASYPQISTREQQTTVRVHDGQQVVVGGLLQNDDVDNLQKVPGLSDIPFFGRLFANRSRTKTKNEVVIIITPQILKD